MHCHLLQRRIGPARLAAVTTAVFWGLVPLMAVCAEDPDPEKSAAEMMTPEAQRAIALGLRYLAFQQHDDGSFGSGSFRGNVAISGLAGLAFMAGGSTPGRGPYGAQVSRCVDYLLDQVQESGYICYPPGVSHGPMYGHGFATLFLAESYGQSLRRDHGEKLRKAVQLIIDTQNQEGGWRYQLQRSEADVSVTVCEVMALRAARNAGIVVPKETIDRSVQYVRRCQNADGGFAYRHYGGESEFARSAAGLVALASAGVYQGKEIDSGLNYLMRFRPRRGSPEPEPRYYYYGHYYAIQVMWLAGGQYWKQWYPAVRDDLVAKQRDGHWRSGISNECATAMACIVLQLPNNCLPIFQR